VPQTNVTIEIRPVLLFTLHNTKNIAHHIMEEMTFYADKIMVMGNSKNLRVFNFTILLKSRKFHAREIYMFYSILGRDIQTTHTKIKTASSFHLVTATAILVLNKNVKFVQFLCFTGFATRR